MPFARDWASIFTLIVSIVGFALALKAFSNSIRQTRFQMLMHIQEMVLHPAMQRAMREIHTLAEQRPEAVNTPSTADDLERVELVLRTYDILAHRLKCAVLPLEEALQTEWMTVLSIWPKVEPFVKRQREVRGVTYKAHLSWLVQRAEEYKERHHPLVKLGEIVWPIPVAKAGNVTEGSN